MTEDPKSKESMSAMLKKMNYFTQSFYFSKYIERSPIFSITIEIAQEKHHLHIFKYDTPSQIAYRFCIQNNWDLACVSPVSAKIKEVFEEYLKNPDLEPKLRRKLEQIIPNELLNSKQIDQRDNINSIESNKKGQADFQQFQKIEIRDEPQQSQQGSQNSSGFTNSHYDKQQSFGLQSNNSKTQQQQQVLQQQQQQLQLLQQHTLLMSSQQANAVQKQQLHATNAYTNGLTSNSQRKEGQNVNQKVNVDKGSNERDSIVKNGSDQKMVQKTDSNCTLQSNSTVSRKYFNCNHITTQVQQKISKRIEDKKQSTDKKKRSISLDNTSSQSQNNFKCIPQLQQAYLLSKDSSSNQIQYSDIMSVPFKDAHSIQFRDTHNTYQKENIADSHINIQDLTNSAQKGQSSYSKKDSFSKIMRDQQQQNGSNELKYFKGLKDSLSNSQTYSNILKEIQQVNNSKERKRDSHSSNGNGSREKLLQTLKIESNNSQKKPKNNNSCERINIHQRTCNDLTNSHFDQSNYGLTSKDFLSQERRSLFLQTQNTQNTQMNTQKRQQQQQQQQQSRSVSPKDANSQTLYERGVHFLGQKQTKIDQFKQSRLDNIMSTCTFVPKTNQKVNEQLLQYRDKSMDPYDQLYQNSKIIQMKKNIIKNKLITEETKEFSFKPALNPISKMIVKTKRQNSITENTPNFETQKTAKITQIQQEMLKECTFHPQISKHSEKLHFKSHNPNLNVYDRLYISTNKKGQKNNQQLYSENYQCTTYPDTDVNGNYINCNCCFNNTSNLNNTNNNNMMVNFNGNEHCQQQYENLQNQVIQINPYLNNGQNNFDQADNYYNPNADEHNNPNYSFAQDKYNNALSTQQQQQQYQMQSLQLNNLSSNVFSNSEQSNFQQYSQNPIDQYTQDQVTHQNTGSVPNIYNNNYNPAPQMINSSNNFNTFNQNTANNLSLLNQSDLNVSSSQMNNCSMQMKQDNYPNQSLENAYNITNNNESLNNQQMQFISQKSGNKKHSKNSSFILNKNGVASNSVNSQGKKCGSSVNTMQSSQCSYKGNERGAAHNESRERKKSSDSQYKKNFSPNKNSIALMEKKKKQRFEEIFILLDSDKDGLISAQNISIQELPDEILVIIAPMLYELEDMEAELTLLEFIEAFERLYKQLPLIDKNKLLLFDTYQKWEQEKFYLNNKDLNFQPQINPQSEIIAQIQRPERGTENLYDLYKDRDRQCEEKLMQKRREKENEINSQCTFHPNIISVSAQPQVEILKQSKDQSQINSCQKSFQEFLSNHTKII